MFSAFLGLVFHVSFFYPYLFFWPVVVIVFVMSFLFFLTVSRPALFFISGLMRRILVLIKTRSPLFFLLGVSLRILCGSEGKAHATATGRQLGCGFHVKQRRNSGDHYRTLTIFIPWNIQAALYPVSTQPSMEPDAAILKATCEHMVAWQTEPLWDSSPPPFFLLRIAVRDEPLNHMFKGCSGVGISDGTTPSLLPFRCNLIWVEDTVHSPHFLPFFVRRGLFPLFQCPCWQWWKKITSVSS